MLLSDIVFILTKWPDIILVSAQTTSLHIDPANLVFVQAFDLKSHTRNVLSWLALTNLFESSMNLADKTSFV